MATDTHIRHGGASRRTLFVLVVCLVAAANPARALAYGWPVKPFDRQHPVRGFFGDPRIGQGAHGRSYTLHFGVDISAPNGTAVYATISGRVAIDARHSDVVRIAGSRGVEFSYWHLIPTVRTGQQAIAYRTMIGRILAPWAHVHFAERRHGAYVNPLRRGALAPYVDQTRPRVKSISFERRGAGIGRRNLGGRFDLVAEVADETPLAVPPPWSAKPVMPAFVRWRVHSRGGRSRWTVAVDFRVALPTAAFETVYARWTRQNRASSRGRYRVVLAREWNSETLPRGDHRLEVAVTDTRGNAAAASATFSIGRR